MSLDRLQVQQGFCYREGYFFLLRQSLFRRSRHGYRRVGFKPARMETGEWLDLGKEYLFLSSQFLISFPFDTLSYFRGFKACPSSIEFVIAFSTILGVEENTQILCLCSYIAELALAFDTSLRHPPSIIAASSMVLTHYCLRKNDMPTLWPDELARVTGFQLKDLVECSVQLSKDVEDVRFVTPQLNMIYRRHSKPSRQSAAEIPIPVLASTTILTAYEERLRRKTW